MSLFKQTWTKEKLLLYSRFCGLCVGAAVVCALV